MNTFEISIDGQMLVLESKTARYQNHLANLSGYQVGRQLFLPDGQPFAKITSSKVGASKMVRSDSGYWSRNPPLVELGIELLPAFYVASTEENSRTHVLARIFAISFEQEGWRVVSNPKVRIIPDEVLFEVPQTPSQRTFNFSNPTNSGSREGEVLGRG